MSQRILIVEDEKEIADTLQYAFQTANMEPIWVVNGSDALDKIARERFDFCVLDVGLPDYDGFDLLRELRQQPGPNKDIPVMFLTARGEEIDRIVGLEIGADDYVCKPFSPREVVARAKVILRRTAATPEEQSSPQTTLGENPFRVNQQNYTVSYQDTPLSLTRSEFALLTTLLNQPGRVFTRRQLLESVFTSNHPSDDRAIDTHVKTLRAKLKTQSPHKEFIITHRGFGYSLELGEQP